MLYRLSYSGAGRDLEQNASDYAICGLTASHFANSYQVTASIMTQAVQLDEADTGHICERELVAMGRVALLHSQAKD